MYRPEASEHRYVARMWLAVFPFMVLFGLLIARNHADAATWSWPQYGVLALLLVLSALLPVVLFSRTIRIDGDGIEGSGLLRRTRLAWGEIRSVKYKGGGTRNGWKQSDKIVLRGDAGAIAVTSAYSRYELLGPQVEATLIKTGGPSVAEARSAFDRSWLSWIYIPHREDLPEVLGALLLGPASLLLLARLLATPLFTAQ